MTEEWCEEGVKKDLWEVVEEKKRLVEDNLKITVELEVTSSSTSSLTFICIPSFPAFPPALPFLFLPLHYCVTVSLQASFFCGLFVLGFFFLVLPTPCLSYKPQAPRSSPRPTGSPCTQHTAHTEHPCIQPTCTSCIHLCSASLPAQPGASYPTKG